MNEQNSQEEAIFEQALRLETAAERTAYLDGACRGQPELRARLELLLAAHFQADGFLDRVPARGGAGTSDDEEVGAVIGRYELLEKIGEGGFGAVYVAEQREPVRRRVALKIIKLGMDTKQVVARFEAERQALAMMDHPNIAKVLDAGATEKGRPYFVMELVRGIKITDYCDQNNLSPRERLDLFIQVCHAIQHAHQKGIIHRDIKPSNILVTLHDGVPVPKVIDFGIAKATEGRLTDATVYTQLHQFIGTPAYMSPEQAEMSGLDLDTRSDIYSLGVLLYELLTGQTPFDAQALLAAGLDEMRRIIREREPDRPSTRLSTMLEGDLATVAKRRGSEAPKLIHLLKGDLDWIVMKCLEKDRARRYETANGLAQDLLRHVNNEPVAARPPSTVYRVQKFVRRNKLMVTAGAMVVAALVAGFISTTWQWRRAVAGEWRAVALELETRRHLYAADMALVQQALEQGNLSRALDLLKRYRPLAGELDLRGWEWRFLRQECRTEELETICHHEGFVTMARFSPDGKWYATAGLDGKVIICETATKHLLQTLTCLVEKGLCRPFCVSPDGGLLVVQVPGGLDVWSTSNTTNWSRLRTLKDGQAPMDFSSDGKLLVARCGEVSKVRVWETKSWESHLREVGFRSAAYSETRLTFLPGGNSLLVYRGAAPVALHDMSVPSSESSAAFRSVPTGTNVGVRGNAAAGHPGGHQVAIVDRSGKVHLLALPGLSDLGGWKANQGDCWDVAFSPDGKWLATAGADSAVRLWNMTTWTNRQSPPNGQTFRGHLAEVCSVHFSPDGRRLLTASGDGTCKIWNTEPESGAAEIPISGGSWHRRGQALIPRNSRELITFTGLTNSFTTNRLAQSRAFERGSFVGPPRPLLANPVAESWISMDARASLVQAGQGRLEVWDVPSERQIGTLPITVPSSMHLSYIVSPDNRFLYEAPLPGAAARLWDLASGELLKVFHDYEEKAWGMVFSPDSRILARGMSNNAAELWDIRAGRALHTLRGHNWHVGSIAFSADGRRLATGSWGKEIHIWEVGSGRRVIPPLKGHQQGVTQIVWSPDGTSLVTCGDENVLRVWNVATGREVAKISEVASFTMSPDGNTLATWMDGRLRLLYVPTMAELDAADKAESRKLK
jgi:eukaryotic-like serine/threonine-protein kinase